MKLILFLYYLKLIIHVEIEAYGFAYKKPYKETYLIGTFIEDDKGRWHMESVKLKNEESKIENEEDVITN